MNLALGGSLSLLEQPSCEPNNRQFQHTKTLVLLRVQPEATYHSLTCMCVQRDTFAGIKICSHQQLFSD
jgi:hypothetical protein